MKSSIASIDPGHSGAICIDGTTYPMPVTLIETKPAVTVYAKDAKGQKQYYKSGPLAGQPKLKTKSPAKFSKELDTRAIYDLLLPCHTLVIELPGSTVGNAAKSSRTTHVNFGKILACAELADCKIVTVAPHKWKADLNLPADKLPTILLVEALSGRSFRTPRGALLDGQADSYAILVHHYQHTLKLDPPFILKA